MKTYNNLYNKLCSEDNILLAFKKARKNKTKKHYVKNFEADLKNNLSILREELVNQLYCPAPLKKEIIKDPKTRIIHKAIFKDRVVHHIIVNILNSIFEPIFIYDSYASRKNKGYHKALKRFDYFKRKVSKNNTKNCYILKADIKHYFQNIDHNILLKILSKKIKEDKVIQLIKKIIETNKKGMPLGNYTSQFLANVYLNDFDHFIKEKLNAKYYIRYVDDFVVLHNSIEQLKVWKISINSFLKRKLNLELHSDKTKIIQLKRGVNFLGFKIFKKHKILKKNGVKLIKRNIKEWSKLINENKISKDKIYEKLHGWISHAKHGNTYILRNKITSSLKNSQPPTQHQ